MKNKTIIITITLILSLTLILLNAETTQAESIWKNNPSNCPATYNNVGDTGYLICGVHSTGMPQVALQSVMDGINPPTTNSAGSISLYDSSLGGGYLIDCLHYSGTTTPFCKQAFCNRASTCFSQNRVTICNANKWSGASGAFTCGNCRPGYCEQSGVCIQIGSTCTADTGIPGSINNACACDPWFVLPPQNITGTGVPTRLAFWKNESSLISSPNLFWHREFQEINCGDYAYSCTACEDKEGCVVNACLVDNTADCRNDPTYQLEETNTRLDVGGDILATGSICDGAGNCLSALSNNLWEETTAKTPTSVYRTDGNVGIGTSTPTEKLHIVDGTSQFKFDGSQVGSGYITTFSMDDTGLKIGHNSALRDLRFRTGNTDRMTITSGGYVGIGTTNPMPGGAAQGLHIDGNLRVDGVVHLSRGGIASYGGPDAVACPTHSGYTVVKWGIGCFYRRSSQSTELSQTAICPTNMKPITGACETGTRLEVSGPNPNGWYCQRGAGTSGTWVRAGVVCI